MPSKTGVCFSPSCGRLLIKSHWPSRSDSLGMASSVVRSPGWEARHGAQNLHSSRRTALILLFSSLCTHLTDLGFDFIVTVPLLPAFCGFFVFGYGVFFFFFSGGFQCPSVNNYSTASCDFGALAGGDERMSFCSVILNRKPLSYNFNKNLSRALFILPLTHLQFTFHIKALFDFFFQIFE